MQSLESADLVSNPNSLTSVAVEVRACPVTVWSLVILLWKMGLALIGHKLKGKK